MKIHNDFRSLDKEIQFLQQELNQISVLRDKFSKEIDLLYNNGFKDKKFIELKTAVEKSGKQLMDLKKSLEQCVVEMQKRSEVIKQYYAVKI
jgi:seryl-tRNA synthetase